MSSGSLNAGAGNPGVDIRLTNSADAFVRVDLNHNVVLGRAGGAHIVVRIQQDVTVNSGDFQSLNLSLFRLDRSPWFVFVVSSIFAHVIPVTLQRRLRPYPLFPASGSKSLIGSEGTHPCQAPRQVPARSPHP